MSVYHVETIQSVNELNELTKHITLLENECSKLSTTIYNNKSERDKLLNNLYEMDFNDEQYDLLIQNINNLTGYIKNFQIEYTNMLNKIDEIKTKREFLLKELAGVK